ncbi:MAG: HD domain-containing phosphohydrolase [Betaproteobacteria bacterium]
MIELSSIRGAQILIVDDQDTNILLLRHILVGSGYTSVSSTTNPTEVAELHRKNNYDIIVLDLNMPVMDGFMVMKELQKVDPDAYLPVLVLTAQPENKMRALKAGAKDFLAKPFDHVEVLTRIHNMLEVRLLYKALRSHNALLEAQVAERTADLRENYHETIVTMTRAAEYKDENTGLHIQRISYYCRELAARLGMDSEFIDLIFYASPMHDIGKIAIPDNVLLKPGSLSPTEWKVMKTHAAVGASILSDTHSPYLKMGAEIAMHHHERWDGSGYPLGAKAEAIPQAARIMNICDVYDALRSRRPYKPPFEHARALEIITHGDTRTLPEHFDPQVLDAFTEHHAMFREIYDTTGGAGEHVDFDFPQAR